MQVGTALAAFQSEAFRSDNSPFHRYLRGERKAMNRVDAMPYVEKTSLFGTAVHAVLRSAAVGPERVGAALRGQGLEVISVDRVEPSLEDVFLDVVEKVQQ